MIFHSRVIMSKPGIHDTTSWYYKVIIYATPNQRLHRHYAIFVFPLDTKVGRTEQVTKGRSMHNISLQDVA